MDDLDRVRAFLEALGPGGLEIMRKQLKEAEQSVAEKKKTLDELVKTHAEKKAKLRKVTRAAIIAECGLIIERNLQANYKARLELQSKQFQESKRALHAKRYAIEKRVEAKEKKFAKLKAFDLTAELEAKRRKDQELKVELEKVLKEKECAIREEEENRRRNDALSKEREKKILKLERDFHKLELAVDTLVFLKKQKAKDGFINKRQK